jgi:glucose-1-phosphate thymidylyltransferase
MVSTNKRYLEFIKDQPIVSPTLKQTNSTIIPPCFIGDGVIIENSVIGPHVSIGDYTYIGDARVKNSIIQKNCTVRNAVLDNSMLGNFVNFEGKSEDLSLGDYSTN